MNIVIFYQYFGTPKGSWSTRIYELAKRWVVEGENVTVVTAPYEKSDIRTSKFIETIEIEGIKVIVINASDSNRDRILKRIGKSLLFSLTSVYYSIKLPADVVIASSGPITVGLPGLFAKWFRGRKLVFEVRDLWPQGAIELGKIKYKPLIAVGRWFEKLCYNNSSLVVPCSKGMEAGVLKVSPNSKTLVITNASDVSLFYNGEVYPQNFPEALLGKKIFLYAGSLGFMDECSQIIQSMDIVEDKTIVVVFAGDGAERMHLEELAGEKLNKTVFFLGLMPKTEVSKWFSISKATFVTFKNVSVLHTSSPNKMFDSFAAGKPVIQSTKGWIMDLVNEEKCGLNVDPDDLQTFAAAINYLASNEDIRLQMCANARRLSATLFNRDILAKEYLSAIRQVASV